MDKNDEERRRPGAGKKKRSPLSSIQHLYNKESLYNKDKSTKPTKYNIFPNLTVHQKYIHGIIKSVCQIGDIELNLSYAQLISILQTFGYLSSNRDNEIEQTDLRKFFQLLDPDRSGVVPCLQVIKLIAKYKTKLGKNGTKKHE
eukprot:UN29401